MKIEKVFIRFKFLEFVSSQPFCESFLVSVRCECFWFLKEMYRVQVSVKIVLFLGGVSVLCFKFLEFGSNQLISESFLGSVSCEKLEHDTFLSETRNTVRIVLLLGGVSVLCFKFLEFGSNQLISESFLVSVRFECFWFLKEMYRVQVSVRIVLFLGGVSEIL